MKILLVLILLLGSLKVYSEELSHIVSFTKLLEYKTQLRKDKLNNKVSIIDTQFLTDRHIRNLFNANISIGNPIRVTNCKEVCDAFREEYKNINISLVIIKSDKKDNRLDVISSSDSLLAQNK